MKKKIFAVIVCTLLITTLASFSATAIKCERKPAINIIKQNSPPSDPVLTAPNSARKNSVFVIKAVSNDPDGDQIYYRFKIGKETPLRSWNGPYTSGYKFNLRVRLIGYIGDLEIGFQAKDVNGAESDWAYHTTTYKNAKSRFFAFEHLLSLFPRLSQILKL